MANDNVRKQFEADFAEFLDEVGAAGLHSREDAEALQELEEAMNEAGIDIDADEDASIALAQVQAADIDLLVLGFLRRRAQRLLRQLHQYVRRYAKCAHCIPLVLQMARLLAAKRYPAAISKGLQAMNCIRRCL